MPTLKQKYKLEEITKFYHVDLKQHLMNSFFFIVRLVCEKCKFDICKEDDPNRFVEYFNYSKIW